MKNNSKHTNFFNSVISIIWDSLCFICVFDKEYFLSNSFFCKNVFFIENKEIFGSVVFIFSCQVTTYG